MAIFNADRKLISSDCTTLIEKWPGPEMRYIGNRNWAYTTTADQQIQFSCVLEQQQELTRTLPATGVLKLYHGCTATADLWILSASIYQLLEQQQQVVIRLPSRLQLCNRVRRQSAWQYRLFCHRGEAQRKQWTTPIRPNNKHEIWKKKSTLTSQQSWKLRQRLCFLLPYKKNTQRMSNFDY